MFWKTKPPFIIWCWIVTMKLNFFKIYRIPVNLMNWQALILIQFSKIVCRLLLLFRIIIIFGRLLGTSIQHVTRVCDPRHPLDVLFNSSNSLRTEVDAQEPALLTRKLHLQILKFSALHRDDEFISLFICQTLEGVVQELVS